jgi:hypothetical protein
MIDPTGTDGYSSDRGRPGGQLMTAGAEADCVAVMRNLSSVVSSTHRVAQLTHAVEVLIMCL